MKDTIKGWASVLLAFGLFFRSFSDLVVTVFLGNEFGDKQLEYDGLHLKSRPLFADAGLGKDYMLAYAAVLAYWAYLLSDQAYGTLSSKGMLYSWIGLLVAANLFVMWWYAGDYLAQWLKQVA